VPEPATKQLKYVGVVTVPYYKDNGKLPGARLTEVGKVTLVSVTALKRYSVKALML